MGTITSHWFRLVPIAALVIATQLGGTEPASAGTIEKVRGDQAIRIAYRPDAPPFSYKEPNSTEPTGYMVNLCQAIAKHLADQLGVPSLKVVYVAVTAANRFEAIEKHDADLLCEPTSATLSRRKQVDFSIATFVDGAGLMMSDTNLHDLKDLSGRKIGVLAGTTTEDELRGTLKTGAVQADIVPATTHDEGLAMLDDGRISAYFADRSILMFLLQRSKAPEKLTIGDNYLSLEPYALALAHGDEDFRLAVDTALSHIYRSGEIITIFNETFGGKVRPTDVLKTLYGISGLPD